MHDLAWPWLAAAADVPWALVHASPPPWWYAIAAIAVLVSLMPLPITLRLAAVVWVVPLAAAVDSRVAEGSAEVTVLDMGEGASIVVQTAHHVLVHDVGDVYGSDGRNAESVLVPFLRSRGVRKIDVLVLSRLTAANAGGVTALLAQLPVTETFVGGDAGMDLPGARRCSSVVAGWNWDGVQFRMATAGSCEIGLKSGQHEHLRFGEITISEGLTQARAERGPRFRQMIEWAVVSGRRDRNGREKHTLRQWREAGITVLTTGDLGAISVRLDRLEGPGLSGMMPATLSALAGRKKCGKSCVPADQ
jgi:competence protein ComEC